MKSILLVLVTVFALSSNAHAAKDWQAELAAFEKSLPTRYTGSLWMSHAWYSGASTTTCLASVAMTGAAFVADTLPVVNGLSEYIGVTVDPQYQTHTYESILSWEAAAQAGRGLMGGGVTGVAEALQYVLLLKLAGREDEAFDGLSKMYASSFATANALFANQGQCMMNLAKNTLLRRELYIRMGRATREPNPTNNVIMN